MSSLLPKNVGTVDRVARIALGVVVLSLAFTGPQSAWGYLGFIPLFTGVFGSCPLYALFGWNTCAVRHA